MHLHGKLPVYIVSMLRSDYRARVVGFVRAHLPVGVVVGTRWFDTALVTIRCCHYRCLTPVDMFIARVLPLGCVDFTVELHASLSLNRSHSCPTQVSRTVRHESFTIGKFVLSLLRTEDASSRVCVCTLS